MPEWRDATAMLTDCLRNGAEVKVLTSRESWEEMRDSGCYLLSGKDLVYQHPLGTIKIAAAKGNARRVDEANVDWVTETPAVPEDPGATEGPEVTARVVGGNFRWGTPQPHYVIHNVVV